MKFAAIITEIQDNKGQICDSILRSLPDWFGIEKAIVDYVKTVERLPTLIAKIDGEVAGFVSVEFHNSYTAEIHVMGVYERYHRHGVGRALINAAENLARKSGAEYLMVKTLGSSANHEPYDRTRQFYSSVGFRPLQEFRTIWDENNPCLVMVKKI